jgi:hypothetical protein
MEFKAGELASISVGATLVKQIRLWCPYQSIAGSQLKRSPT